MKTFSSSMATSRPRASRSGDPPWEIALLFPSQGEWTEDDYLALDTRRLIELSEGCLEVLPMPTVLHQLLVKFLAGLLDAHVKAHALGVVLFAPLPVRLWSGKIREPDIVFLRPGRITNPRYPPVGADLVMEVVSEGEENRARDLEIKRREYAQAQIAEYWIVDPERREIAVLVLDGADYQVHGSFAAGSTATSPTLPGFKVDVTAAFAVLEDISDPHVEQEP